MSATQQAPAHRSVRLRDGRETSDLLTRFAAFERDLWTREIRLTALTAAFRVFGLAFLAELLVGGGLISVAGALVALAALVAGPWLLISGLQRLLESSPQASYEQPVSLRSRLAAHGLQADVD